MAVQNRFQAAGASDIAALRRATNNAFTDLAKQVTTGLNNVDVEGGFEVTGTAALNLIPKITTFTDSDNFTVTWSPDEAGAGLTAASVVENGNMGYVTSDLLFDQSYLSSIPNEYLTQTEGDGRYLQVIPGEYLTQTEGDGRYERTISPTNRVSATEVATGAVSNDEFNRLTGVTSSIQSQLDGKQASGNYLTSIPAEYLTQTEGDNRYEPLDSAYTKSESDGRYEPLDSAYTKSESDGRYLQSIPGEYLTQTEGDNRYEPLDSAYTKSESDGRYLQDGEADNTPSWVPEEDPGYITAQQSTLPTIPTGNIGQSDNYSLRVTGPSTTTFTHIGTYGVGAVSSGAASDGRYELYAEGVDYTDPSAADVRALHGTVVGDIYQLVIDDTNNSGTSTDTLLASLNVGDFIKITREGDTATTGNSVFDTFEVLQAFVKTSDDYYFAMLELTETLGSAGNSTNEIFIGYAPTSTDQVSWSSDVVLTDSNNAQWRLVVSTTGALSTEAVV